MKTYSTKNKPNKNKKLYLALILVASCVITLTVMLIALSGGSKAPVVDTPSPTPDQGVVTPIPTPDDEQVSTPDPDQGADAPVVVAPTFTLPISSGTLIRECSLTSLVYMPSLNMWKTHNGMDFSASENSSVLAVTDGKVKAVENTTLEGVVVTVEHAGGLVSVYKSLSSASVSVGDSVQTGSVLGVVGTMLTENSDGIHLHLEMTKDGALVDPAQYIGYDINK